MSRFNKLIFPTGFEIEKVFKDKRSGKLIKLSVSRNGWIIENRDKYGYKRIKNKIASLDENHRDAMMALESVYRNIEEVNINELES